MIGEVLGTSVIGSGGQWGATIDDPSIYLLDEANGATLLTIPFGHTLDAVCFALGEIKRLSATTATRRSTLTRKSTGEQVPVTAADQVAVTGVFDSGAVASFHYRGGHSVGTNFRWEINGTGGDIIATGGNGHLQYGQVEVLVSQNGGALGPSAPPARYAPVEVDPKSLSHTLAQAYSALAEDLRDGEHRAPRFADTLHRHRTLDDIRTAAGRATG